LGGVLKISLQHLATSQDNTRSITKAASRLYTELDHESKVGGSNNFSDEVERLEIIVAWEPVHGALGVAIDARANKLELRVVSILNLMQVS
jgi:hypothetical protein